MPTSQNNEYNNQVPSTPSTTRIDEAQRRERDQDPEQMLSDQISSDPSAQALPSGDDTADGAGPGNPLSGPVASTGNRSTFPSTDLLETSDGVRAKTNRSDTIQ